MFYPVNDDLKAWAAGVAAARTKLGLGQSKCGLSQAFVSNVETGRTCGNGTITGKTLAKLRVLAANAKHPMPPGYDAVKLADEDTVIAPRKYSPRAILESAPVRPRAPQSRALVAAVLDLVGSGKLAAGDAVNLLSLARG